MDKGSFHVQKYSKCPKYYYYERMTGVSSPYLTTVHCYTEKKTHINFTPYIFNKRLFNSLQFTLNKIFLNKYKLDL